MKPKAYRITVRGLLDESWSSIFAGMEISRGRDGMTRLTGSMPDQSALHGALGRLRDLNLEIVSVLQIHLLAAERAGSLSRSSSHHRYEEVLE